MIQVPRQCCGCDAPSQHVSEVPRLCDSFCDEASQKHIATRASQPRRYANTADAGLPLLPTLIGRPLGVITS